MTRAVTRIQRALVLAVMLLSLTGGVANADNSAPAGGASAETQGFPDDPGYGE